MSVVGGLLAWLSVGSGIAAATSRSAYVPEDLNSNATVSQFDIGAAGGLSPKSPAVVTAADTNAHDVAIAPDGKSVYVLASPTGSGDVLQYSVAAGGLLSPKTPASVAAGTSPDGLAISPDGKSVYVANQLSISQYDVGAGGALSAKMPATINVPGASLQQVAISPDGRSVYVVDYAGGDVLQYDVGAGGALSPKTPATVASGTNPEGIAVSPDGTSVYVVNRGEKDVALLHVGAGGKLSKVGTTVAGSEPTFVAVSPDGKNVYVVDRNGGIAAGAVLQYDVGSGGVLLPKTPASVTAGLNADGIAMGPDGKSVYVSNNQSSDVSQYDVGSGGALSPKTPATIAAGLGAAGVGVVPDQGPVASFTASAAPAGSPTRFDGSTSSDTDGTIARYDWSFGDGTSAAGGSATPTHTYSAPGTYTVRLTVTDDGGCSTAIVFTGQTAACNGGSPATTTATVGIAKRKAGTGPGSRVPRFSGVFESARRWRAGNALPRIARARKLPIGTTFGFTINESVRMRLAFTRTILGRRVSHRCVLQNKRNKPKPKCTRTVTAATLTFTVGAGSHRVRFQGRVSRHKTLAAGRYTLIMTATNAAGQRRSAKLRFTIVKR
ncbi:MAG: beta-propeller fold lactonase family protein [Solirubrobacteraceae bacterium]